MEVKDQISKAIAQHGLWKSRLLKAIDLKSNEFDINIVKTDNNCEFGKWLYNTMPENMRNSPRYQKVIQYHANFHKETARILQMIVNNQTDDAKFAVSINSDFAQISSNLTLELTDWKREF